MQHNDPSYDQPEKIAVRNRVIARAVNELTTKRSDSPIITGHDFDRTVDYCVRLLDRVLENDLSRALKDHVEDWHSLQRSRVGVKSPEDLSILFLAGPNPVPDLMEFKRAGVPFSNMWAIEGDGKAYEGALGVLGREGLPIKLHHGSLQQFFAVVPQQFDIVYFDACGQLFGGKPNTIHVLRELFLNQRLAPLSVLITNFCEPYPNTPKDLAVFTALRNRLRNSPSALSKSANSADNVQLGVVNGKVSDPSPEEKELQKWARLIGLWSYANGDNDTWLQTLEEFVDDCVLPDVLPHYSQFVTEFIIRFAGQLLPWWRTVALPGARREYFSSEQAVSAAVNESEKIIEALSDPLYSCFRHVLFTDGSLEKNSSLHEFYFKEALEGRKLGDAVKMISVIRNFFESTWGDTFYSTDHIRKACSPDLIKVLEGFEWFDAGKRVFCYDPMPHLIVDLLIGLYGHPYHANTRKLDRIAYKAKDTVMFTDLFVFDQARYVYDLLPTLQFLRERFSVSQQLVLRICLDAIRRHAHFGCPDLFLYADLAASGEEGFQYWQPPRRESFGCEDIESEDELPKTQDFPF